MQAVKPVLVVSLVVFSACSGPPDREPGRDASVGPDTALDAGGLDRVLDGWPAESDGALASDGGADGAVRDATWDGATRDAAGADAGTPLPTVTRITVMDHFQAPDGTDQYDTEFRWENRDLNYHGEAVAQSAIYGYSFMAEAAGLPELAPGNQQVVIERLSTVVPSGTDWLSHMQQEIRAAYQRGSRLFNMSFGIVADSTPTFDAWLDSFAADKARAGDPILIFIGAGNDPRNLSTNDSPPPEFGQRKFFPNYLADETRPWWIQVTGLEDDLSQVRWTGYESTYSDRWPVDVAASIKLWAFDSTGSPYWLGGRVGTSFSAPIAGGVFLFLQAYLRYNGVEPDLAELRDFVLEEAVAQPFTFQGHVFQFPTVEIHTGDEYTNWSEQRPYALDSSLGIVCMFDDPTDQWVYASQDPNGVPTGPDVTKEIVRRGLLAPANADLVLQAVAAHYGL